MINIKELKKTLNDYNIMISFSGHFSQGIIEELSNAIRNHLENNKKSKSNAYNIIAIFVEQAQNITNYLDKVKQSVCNQVILDSGIVGIGESDNRYFITSGNLILKDDIKELTDKIELVNSLDKSELKKLYKETLKKEIKTNGNGAGLGLILMARKSNAKIQYSISDYNDEMSYFSINVFV